LFLGVGINDPPGNFSPPDKNLIVRNTAMKRLVKTPGTVLAILGLVTLAIAFLWVTPGAATPYQLVNLVSDDTSVIPAANANQT
jgi:hypothetical protein